MEFDINRVYTALNADELKLGSTVIVADSLAELMRKVKANAPQDLSILRIVWDDAATYRFTVSNVEGSVGFMLCYLVSEPNEPRRMTNRELARWLAQGNGQWKGAADTIGIAYSYGLDDHEIPDSIMIRGWNETEWHEPIVQEADE